MKFIYPLTINRHQSTLRVDNLPEQIPEKTWSSKGGESDVSILVFSGDCSLSGWSLRLSTRSLYGDPPGQKHQLALPRRGQRRLFFFHDLGHKSVTGDASAKLLLRCPRIAAGLV